MLRQPFLVVWIIFSAMVFFFFFFYVPGTSFSWKGFGCEKPTLSLQHQLASRGTDSPQCQGLGSQARLVQDPSCPVSLNASRKQNSSAAEKPLT